MEVEVEVEVEVKVEGLILSLLRPSLYLLLFLFGLLIIERKHLSSKWAQTFLSGINSCGYVTFPLLSWFASEIVSVFSLMQSTMDYAIRAHSRNLAGIC